MLILIQYTKWWDPFLDPANAGASVHRVALYVNFGTTRYYSIQYVGLLLVISFHGYFLNRHFD